MMTEILLGLILLFIALDWWEHSNLVRDRRVRLPGFKRDVRRRLKNWRHDRRA